MAEQLKDIRSECPKADHEMVIHAETGLPVVRETGLVPIFFLSSVPERGWNRGEVAGVLPHTAVVVLKNNHGMQLVGAAEMATSGKAKPVKKEAQPAAGAGAAA